jgi:hypothetical protein
MLRTAVSRIAILIAVALVAATAVVGVLASTTGPASGHVGPDDADPSVANLDPDLRAALEAATAAAAEDGVTIVLNSGWRSREEQERLLQDAIAEYGSAEEAARWVATPDTSAHVTGDAIDIGPLDAVVWLGQHGPEYGLCPIYANEPWHFELHPAPCPPLVPDAAHRVREVPRATGSGAPTS